MIVAKKIWTFRKNAIWDDGKYYIIEHIPTGAKGYFDRSDKALKVVQQKIKKYGIASLQVPSGQFRLDRGRGDRPYLAQVLYAIYSGKPLSWVRKGYVRFRDGNCLNLTSENLAHTHMSTADNENRVIYQVGDYIFLRHKESGKTFFCKNDPELFELLCNYRLIWVFLKKKNKLMVHIMRGGHSIKDLRPYFHQIVYAFEHYGARSNNFIGKIREMRLDLKKKGLTIDHLDNTQENAMPWNLSLMTAEQNSAKNDLIGRVRYPFFLFAVYFEGKYRIYCGRVWEPTTSVLDFSCWICETPDDLIDFIDKFLSSEWEDGLSPAKNIKEHPDEVCFQNYFGDFGASGIRDELIIMREEDFNIWKAKSD